MAKIGDTVRFLNDVGGGEIVRIDGRTAYVRDPEDGFETPMPLTECIVVPATATVIPDQPAPKKIEPKKTKTTVTSKGERLHPTRSTYALLFEPQDVRRLSQTAFDLYLVNDSDYKILYAVACHDTDSVEWSLIGAGEAEPQMQVFLGEADQASLNSFAHLSVQILAVKPDRTYNLQEPLNFRTRFDLTRLAKLHCFTSTDYSTEPVLTIPLNAPQTDLTPLSDFGKTPQKDIVKHSESKEKRKRREEPQVVDLHIHELLDTTAGLQPADMLAYQLREFERRMEEAAKHPGSKIIFIHGKGEGVLRAALLERLHRRWPNCEAQDASFREYGFGATQITIRR